jgi:hypothetical protein
MEARLFSAGRSFTVVAKENNYKDLYKLYGKGNRFSSNKLK